MKRYAIWNKKDKIITPNGEVLTPEQWIERFPMFGEDNIVPICWNGEVNGEYYNTLGRMVKEFTAKGCDFSGCTTNEEKLNAIEAFEDAMEASYAEAREEARANEALQADSLASIAASLEFQNMMALPDVEV